MSQEMSFLQVPIRIPAFISILFPIETLCLSLSIVLSLMDIYLESLTNTGLVAVRICPIIVAFYSADGIFDQLLMLGISPDEG